MLKQQPSLPAFADARNLLLEAAAIKALAVGGGGVGVALGGAGEGNHDSTGAVATGQAAVGFDLRHPGGDLGQAGLAQGEQIAAQPFGMGRQHARRHKASGLTAPPADHLNRLITPSELMGQGQAHEAPTKNHDWTRLLSRGRAGGHGRAQLALKL